MAEYPRLGKFNEIVFKTKSGNIARIQVIGPGGLRIKYVYQDTEADRQDVIDYVKSKIPDLEVTTKSYGKFDEAGLKKERADYLKFLEED